MTPAEREDIARRKSLLVTRSELERMQLALVVHELRDRMLPAPGEPSRSSRPAAVAAALVGIGVPLFGRRRLARLLRGVSLAMTAWRIARNWRSGR